MCIGAAYIIFTVNIKCNKNCKRVSVKNKNVFLAIYQLVYDILYIILFAVIMNKYDFRLNRD